MSGASRLSSMLAAFQSLSRNAASSSTSTEPPSLPRPADPPTQPGSSRELGRRRSLRLSAKAAGDAANADEADDTSADAGLGKDVPAPENAEASGSAEPTPSETVVNDEEPAYEADFTDEEVDVDASVRFFMSTLCQ